MISSVHFTAVLDTNVLYPLYVRDILLWYAHCGLFSPKLTNHIMTEWDDVMERKDIDKNIRESRIESVKDAFPFAFVDKYESLIESLDLPDVDDRHVLAAAIKTNANVIVTENIKDFPDDCLSKYGLTGKRADDFIVDTIDLNPKIAVDAFKEMVLCKTNPELGKLEVLDRLRSNNLKQSADYLHSLL